MLGFKSTRPYTSPYETPYATLSNYGPGSYTDYISYPGYTGYEEIPVVQKTMPSNMGVSSSYGSLGSYGLSTGNSGLGLKSINGFGSSSSDGLQLDPFKSNQSWLDTAGKGMNILQGLGNLYLGMKNYGLMKRQLAESKRQFDMNWDAQRRLTNARMRDRQEARVLATRGRHATPVDEYMAQNGIK